MADEDRFWPAPTAHRPVRACVPVPGSKSQTNRALVLAALADRPGTISNALDARDARLMIGGLRALGCEIDSSARDGSLLLRLFPGPLRSGGSIDVGLAGTVMRFLPPLAALADGDTIFDGDARARERPMAPLLSALRALGVHVDGESLPCTVHGTGSIAGGEVVIDASASSQFLSALLLVAPRCDAGLLVRHVGGRLPSLPHIEMTVAMLKARGVSVQRPDAETWQVESGPIAGIDEVIEPDLSNAAPFLAAAMATRGAVTVPGWPRSTIQPGDALRDLLQQMGAAVSLDESGLTVSMDGPINGLEADLGDVGELTPTIAALSALAESPSRLHGIRHLRGHETDRLQALADEINHLGGDVAQTEDGLVIRPTPLHGGRMKTYADHRMATAGAILGLRYHGISVEDIATTDKTLPGFADTWSAMVGA